MQVSWVVRFCCLLFVVHASATSASAYHRDYRVPLFGYHGNVTAMGSARYVGQFNEPNVKYLEELTIDVKFVPLTPGTVLVVYVDKEMVGTLTITNRQTGSLKVTSEERKYVPKIEAGTMVKLTKLDGTIVIQ